MTTTVSALGEREWPPPDPFWIIIVSLARSLLASLNLCQDLIFAYYLSRYYEFLIIVSES